MAEPLLRETSSQSEPLASLLCGVAASGKELPGMDGRQGAAAVNGALLLAASSPQLPVSLGSCLLAEQAGPPASARGYPVLWRVEFVSFGR